MQTAPYQSFRFLDVLVSEKELAVEIAQVDRIEVDDVDFSKTREDDIL